MNASNLGPLMIDIQGTELTGLDRERLCHPLVGGLILFSRNYASGDQLSRLTAEMHALRPGLLIAVDHEGGRVQRFREGFTRLPPMAALGALWDQDEVKALAAARDTGFVLAAELRARGVDLSFTPVLDLNHGVSTVIGTRSFHRRPEVVVALAGALIEGLTEAGMASCGKHFPGHGYVEADSHVAIPVDLRSLDALQEDILPFRQLPLQAVMPAHVTYPEFDDKTSCFSRKWNDYLRKDVKFDGVVFSDDLSMEGASVVGDVVARVEAAWAAGCDMLLVCNSPERVGDVLSRWQPEPDGARRARVARLLPVGVARSMEGLGSSARYRAAVEVVTTLSDA